MNTHANLTALIALALSLFACGSDSGTDAAGPMEISGVWDTSGCLDNIVEAPGATDYIVTRDIQVRADLCIKPGVVVEFAEGEWITVYNEGSINAVGTAEEPVIFRGSNATPGSWGPIIVHSESALNVLEHVVIDGSGAAPGGEGLGSPCSVAVGYLTDKEAQLAIRHTRIVDGLGDAIVNYATLVEVSNTTIQGHENAPINSRFQGISALDSGNVFESNGVDAILLDQRELLMPMTLTAAPVPYRVGYGPGTRLVGAVEIAAELNIAEGATLQFEPGFGLLVTPTGTLTIAGSSDAPVTLTKTPEGDNWSGIAVVSENANAIDHAVISGTGGEFPSGGWGITPSSDRTAAVYVGNNVDAAATVSVTNTSFQSVAGSAFYRFDPVNTVTETGNDYGGIDVIAEH